jgi:hypothetical protein
MEVTLAIGVKEELTGIRGTTQARRHWRHHLPVERQRAGNGFPLRPVIIEI